MNAKFNVRRYLDDTGVELTSGHSISDNVEQARERVFTQTQDRALSTPISLRRLSPWSQSRAKRVFDCTCVLLALPLLIPIFLMLALAVRLTSSGPVLFLQKRVGRHGRIFTIIKFRTLVHSTDVEHHAVTTAANQRFTPVGPFLRRWKLDELPQLLNVLLGDMSLVGPRPKLPEHLVSALPCRPGITGAATVAFAREEKAFAHLTKEQLDTCYHAIILPAKHSMDAQYMARATLRSDLRLIIDSVLRRWDESVLDSLPIAREFQIKDRVQRVGKVTQVSDFDRPSVASKVKQPATAD